MQKIVVVLSVVLLAGCAVKVIGANERMVMVDAGTAQPAEAMQAASAECAKFGRHARLNTKPTEDRQWVFDCIQ